MTAGALHIAWKDVRQHRAWIAAYLAVAVVRALLIGSGLDARVGGPAGLYSLGGAYVVLCVLHVALLVTLGVQLVHGDRLVGTTAFWLTRPVSRRALLASKLGVACALLVVVPVVLDGFVVLANGLGWIDALGAVAEGVFLRLAVVLPVMALASVTADLAVFVVGAIAMLFGTFTLVALLQWLGFTALRGHDMGESLTVAVLGIVAAGSLAALAHQVFTRRAARTDLVIVATIAVTLVAAARLDRPFLGPPQSLEPGWVDPGRVSVALAVHAPQKAVGIATVQRPWVLFGESEVAGATPNVVLAPFGFNVTLPGAQGEPQRNVYRLAWGVSATGNMVRKDLVEHLLGDVRLLDATGAPEYPRAAVATLTETEHEAYMQAGRHPSVEVILGALAYQACPPLPLEPGARGRCGGRQIELLSAEYRDGKCSVAIRDVTAGFAIDLRRPSRVWYILVNRATRQGLAQGVRDFYGGQAVFGRAAFVTLAEHIAVMQRNLVYAAPRDAEPIGADWLRDSVIVPLQVRDIGQFTVRAGISSSSMR